MEWKRLAATLRRGPLRLLARRALPGARRERYELAQALHLAGNPDIHSDWQELVILTSAARDLLDGWLAADIPHGVKLDLIASRIDLTSDITTMTADDLRTLVALARPATKARP